jgi:type IV pilus assembly protein PilM
VIVDIGAGGTKILILRGHQICFYRRLELGGAAMNEAVARTLNIAPQEAARLRREVARSAGTAADDTPERTLAVTDAVRGVLLEIAKEIGLCLRYFSVTFRGSRPEHVLLTGGEANIPLVHETLAAELGGTVQVAQPLHNLDLSSETVRIERRGHLAQWAVATGLALRSAAGVDAAATSPAVGPATANAARGAA